MYRLKLYIRDLAAFFVFVALCLRGRLAGLGQEGIRILVYHSIKEVPRKQDMGRITVGPSLFERQMKYLVSAGYKIITMDELLGYIKGNKDIEEKSIVLTFDDGFTDTYDFGQRILRSMNLKATYFLVSSYIGSNEVFPWYSAGSTYSKPIAREQVLNMISEGATIGSHTSNHTNLGGISYDRDRLYKEAAGSKKILEAMFKAKVDYFAYPFGCNGSYNKVTEEAIRQSGYMAACVNIFGANKKGDNPFELKRTRIDWNDTLLKFRMKLAGAYDWVDSVRRSEAA